MIKTFEQGGALQLIQGRQSVKERQHYAFKFFLNTIKLSQKET
jgi:hypothetical protein